jgi:HSP20 family protein
MAKKTESGKTEARHDVTEGKDAQSKLPAEQKGGEPTRARPAFRPRVDIGETEEGLMLIADLPGAEPDRLHITLDGRDLVIRAEVDEEEPEGFSPGYREYEVGDYECHFRLAGDFNSEGVEAALKDGVLTLKIPKAAEKEARQIRVKPG